MSSLGSHSLRLLLAALAAFGTVAPAAAGDLIFGLGANTTYDDNVYGTTDRQRSDVTLQFVPKVRFIERTGAFDFDLRYDPTYEYFIEEDGLRGFNHSARAAASWRPSPTTLITLEDDWQRYRNTRLLTVGTSGTGSNATPIERGSRDRFSRNVAQLSAQHVITPTQRITASAYHSLWEFNEATRVDQQNFGGSLEYLHTLDANLRLGASVSISHSAIDELPSRPTADTTYYSTALVLEWQPNDRFLVELSAGPAYVDSKQERQKAPGPLVLGEVIPEIDEGQSVTAFASTSASWHFERGRLAFGYSRRDDFGSALGFSAVTDTVTASASYELLRNLSADLTLGWEGRNGHAEYVTFQPEIILLPFPPFQWFSGFYFVDHVEGDQELSSAYATLSATYRITETTKVAAWTTWRTQDDRSEVFTGFGDVERFHVYLGVTHQFAAIRW